MPSGKNDKKDPADSYIDWGALTGESFEDAIERNEQALKEKERRADRERAKQEKEGLKDK